MNSAKQYMNSEPMWSYCSRAEKKKKKAENVDTAKREETRKPNTHLVSLIFDSPKIKIEHLNQVLFITETKMYSHK